MLKRYQQDNFIHRERGAAFAQNVPEAIQAFGQGGLSEITTIHRINTKGGTLEGACKKAGTFRSIAYSMDYIFLKK